MRSWLQGDKTGLVAVWAGEFDKKWWGRRIHVTGVILCVMEGCSRVWNSWSDIFECVK